jgi:hypothetical protein
MEVEKNTPQEILNVVQAHLEGKRIRAIAIDRVAGSWVECPSPNWNFKACRFEVMTEPRTIYVNDRDGNLSGHNWNLESDAEACRSFGSRTVKFIEVME